MKKIIFIISIMSVSYMGIGQEVKMPERAQKVFVSDFNGDEASEINWEKNGTGYKVSFVFNDKPRQLIFDDEGNFRENWISIPNDKVVESVLNHIAENYPEGKIIQAYQLITATAPERNVIEIDSGNYILQLHYRPNGDFYLSKVIK